MRPRNLIAGFLWRFALVYGLLIVPWPGFNAGYGRYFRALGELVFAREGGQRLLRFEPVPPELHRVLDTRIALANRDQLGRDGRGPGKLLELDSRGVGWVPAALLLALIAATPVPWRRRGWALLWGMVAVHGFILFSVDVYLWNNSAELSLLTLSPFWQEVVGGLDETLIVQLEASFVVPVLIWMLVTVRMEDLKAWRSAGASGPSGRGGAKSN